LAVPAWFQNTLKGDTDQPKMHSDDASAKLHFSMPEFATETLCVLVQNKP
jgi:hypothetical protein